MGVADRFCAAYLTVPNRTRAAQGRGPPAVRESPRWPTRLRGWHARRRRRPSPHYPYVYVDSNGGAATVDGAALTGTGSVFCTDGSFTGYNVCNLDIADADHQIV